MFYECEDLQLGLQAVNVAEFYLCHCFQPSMQLVTSSIQRTYPYCAFMCLYRSRMVLFCRHIDPKQEVLPCIADIDTDLTGKRCMESR